MQLDEAFTTALGSLAGHKLRSALAMLGVVFGVGAVIAMLSIGAGAERQALELIERLGTRNVILRAKNFADEELREIRQRSPGLAMRDGEAILESVPGVELVAPRIEIDPWVVLSAQGTTDAAVYGVSERHHELAGLVVGAGRFLDALDIRDHAQVAVIGEGVRRALFGLSPALGSHLKIDDVWLTVIGVLSSDASKSQAESFQGVTLGSAEDAIYLPVSTALRKFDHPPLRSPLSEIVVRVQRSDDPQATSTAARIIERLMERMHSGADDWQLIVPEALLEQSRRTQRLFNLVMGSIAGISLVVGGIGIMNILLATVLERTREIGLRRAVGARRRDIVVQFLVESFTISALGGLLGVALGLGIARIIAASAGWPTVVTPLTILMATGVAVLVGLASGLYPAQRAAALDPIESLRYE